MNSVNDNVTGGALAATPLALRGGLGLYRGLGRLATPVLAQHLRRRIARGKEDPARVEERWGRNHTPRPEGTLIWMHAASIGESLSILPVIGRLTSGAAPLSVLLTTITRSSAELVATRLPAGAVHAYAPLDTAPALERFLAHWRPAATVLVEQELWPLLLAMSPAPRLLINARLSERTARRWRRLPMLARWLAERFEVILAQSETDAARWRALGASRVEVPGNLKTAASPLEADPTELKRLRAAIGARPVWLAASTHAPEEEWIAAADLQLRDRFPSLLTIIVPRHPDRAAEIEAQIARGDCRRRSQTRLPDAGVGIYVVDSFGELGLFYRLAGFALIGGSLIPHGGQNPLEPARLARPALFGPHMENFADAAAALLAAGAARRVDRSTLAHAVAHWLDADGDRMLAGNAAERCVATMGDAVADATASAIRTALGHR